MNDSVHAPTADAVSASDRWLAVELLTLGLALAANSLLGPLVSGVIAYRFSDTLIYQGIGLDFVSLTLVAPLCLVSASLVLAGRRIGPPLALGLGAYSAYMAVQYAIGPEYQALPGNNERFFLLHLAIFVIGGATVIRAWTTIDARALPPTSRRGHRALGSLLFTLGLLLIVRYVTPLTELLSGEPTFPEYQANATSFLLIAWMDLGVFAAAAVVGGVSLMRGHAWAKKALYGIVGWLALVAIAVAAMAVTMQIHEDPAATAGQTFAFVAAAFLLTALAAWLHGRLVVTSGPGAAPRDGTEDDEERSAGP